MKKLFFIGFLALLFNKSFATPPPQKFITIPIQFWEDTVTMTPLIDTISFQATIRDVFGSTVYIEQDINKTTNFAGIINLTIGDNSATTAYYDSISWKHGPYTLELEADYDNGTNFMALFVSTINSPTIPNVPPAITDYVNLTSNQNIAGNKTFTGLTTMTNRLTIDNSYFRIRQSGVSRYECGANYNNGGYLRLRNANNARCVEIQAVNSFWGGVISVYDFNGLETFNVTGGYSNSGKAKATITGELEVSDRIIVDNSSAARIELQKGGTNKVSLRNDLNAGGAIVVSDDQGLGGVLIESRGTPYYDGGLIELTNKNSNQVTVKARGGYTSSGTQGEIWVDGRVRADSYLTNSDRRLKKDIRPVGTALDIVNGLTGYYYYWESPNKSKKEQIGFIAQEVESILPQLVETDESGYKSVDYTSTIPVLIQAVKEQQNLINALTKRINELENNK